MIIWFIIEVMFFMFIKWSYKCPRIKLTIKPRMVITFWACNPITPMHIYRSNIGVWSRRSNRIRHIYFTRCHNQLPPDWTSIRQCLMDRRSLLCISHINNNDGNNTNDVSQTFVHKTLAWRFWSGKLPGKYSPYITFCWSLNACR